MDTYYQILGITPGSSQLEVKKAYFRLIRKYSPESDPQQFQVIREAYEKLQKAATQEEGPDFAPNDDPAARQFLMRIEKCAQMGDNGQCMEICEDASKYFPADLHFLYLLTIFQRKCGKTGKAVKTAEHLAGMQPNNKWFQKELALSYIERGFAKKAIHACDKAYALGCRETGFILGYSLECNVNRRYDDGVKILLEFICQEKRWRREEIRSLVEAYVGLMSMAVYTAEPYTAEILGHLQKTIKNYKIYLQEYLLQLVAMLISMSKKRSYTHEGYLLFRESLLAMQHICTTREESELVDFAIVELGYQHILNDHRLDEVFQYAYEAYFDNQEEDEEIVRFSLADVQLCMIERQETVLDQIGIVRQEYPHFYDKLHDFIEKLQFKKNLIYLKERLLKIYCQLEPYISGGYYFAWYPQEKVRLEGKPISKGVTRHVYTRSEKKISRNAPCPCGSGKKYKHCCMTNLMLY